MSQWVYLGNIGIVPVWAEVGVALDVKTDISAQASLHFRYGMRKEQDATFGIIYENENVEWVKEFLESSPQTVPFSTSINGELNLGISLEPNVAVNVYGLAGIKTGPSIRSGVSFRTENTELSGYLEGSISWNIGVSGDVLENLNPQPSLSIDLWNDEWRIFPEEEELTFIRHPSDQEVNEHESAYFSCDVFSEYPISYQWYHDGTRLLFQANSFLIINSVTQKHAGNYRVRAISNGEFLWSDIAELTIIEDSGSVPAGMVLISGGTNSGMNPLGDGESYNEDYPESYSLTVNAFLRSKRVLAVEKAFAGNGWTFCVEWLVNGGMKSAVLWQFEKFHFSSIFN